MDWIASFLAMTYALFMKSILRWLLRILFLGGVFVASILLWILSYGDTSFAGKADCGVVFGAAVWRDDVPSHALYDRVMAGVDLYQKEQVTCLILSGGPSTYGAHEVDVMKKVVLEKGVDVSDLILDYEGLSTEKTLDNIEDKTKLYVMISNDFHLARIRLLSWKKGIGNASVHGAEYLHGRYGKESWFTLREVGGVLYGMVFVW